MLCDIPCNLRGLLYIGKKSVIEAIFTQVFIVKLQNDFRKTLKENIQLEMTLCGVLATPPEKSHMDTIFRSCYQRCSIKKTFLEIAQNSPENTCVRVSFLIKLQALGLKFYLKRDTNTGVFLRILRYFQEHLSYRTSPGDCFRIFIEEES